MTVSLQWFVHTSLLPGMGILRLEQPRHCTYPYVCSICLYLYWLAPGSYKFFIIKFLLIIIYTFYRRYHSLTPF